jgi:hypothetical protein
MLFLVVLKTLTEKLFLSSFSVIGRLPQKGGGGFQLKFTVCREKNSASEMSYLNFLAYVTTMSKKTTKAFLIIFYKSQITV